MWEGLAILSISAIAVTIPIIALISSFGAVNIVTLAIPRSLSIGEFESGSREVYRLLVAQYRFLPCLFGIGDGRSSLCFEGKFLVQLLKVLINGFYRGAIKRRGIWTTMGRSTALQ